MILLFLFTSINQGQECLYIFPPRSQNYIINFIVHDIILAHIVAEVKQSKFYSVLADEVTATTLSNYLFSFYFVDSEGNIHDEFVAFSWS